MRGLAQTIGAGLLARVPALVPALSLVPLLAVSLLLAPTEATARGKRKPAADPVSVCKSNADCVLVTDGCCGCNEGGKQRAIPARARDAYEKKRTSLCRKTMCPALMSDHSSCIAGEAVCRAGVCELGS